jgi:hypothetical protein
METSPVLASKAAGNCCAGELLLEKRYDSMSAADAHLQRISDHVSAYLQIVRSQLLATVPKAVVHCMVCPSKESLLTDLQEEIAGGSCGSWIIEFYFKS